MNRFVINRLRRSPVEYTVKISHFVSGGEWQMGIELQDVRVDDTSRISIASDLRTAADWLEAEND
jgi:hypothetical protein